ncbi:MAG: peroxiredoxin family protein [Actinomycetia bacterium]|nr:peroxiredoxin family protein [Actinomycetes bacterium]
MVELHHGLPELRAEGIKLYAVSYDDTEALGAYVGASGVEFTMLSDVDSDVINRYGVLNTLVQPDDVPFYGVPLPGFFLLDEDGMIVDKLFNRHFANREGIETVAEDDGIRITAFLRGGGGVLRIGPRRRLIVRLEMPDGLHTYGEPVPDGMVATQIDVEGSEGFCWEEIGSPPTRPLQLPGVGGPLHVWDGTVVKPATTLSVSYHAHEPWSSMCRSPAA